MNEVDRRRYRPEGTTTTGSSTGDTRRQYRRSLGSLVTVVDLKKAYMTDDQITDKRRES